MQCCAISWCLHTEAQSVKAEGHGKFLTGIDIKRGDPLPNILEQHCCSAVIDLSGDVTACVLISRLSSHMTGHITVKMVVVIIINRMCQFVTLRSSPNECHAHIKITECTCSN